MLRCLTIRQPWASLIMIGAKTVETRSWPTSYRGTLVIHASSTYGPGERHAASCSVPLGWIRAAGLKEDALPLGVLLGIVELVDVLPVAKLGTLIDRKTPAGNREFMMGNYAPGRWGWVLKGVRQLGEPIPASGRLGLWQLPSGLQKIITREAF
jgi:activating signal cointegrator 1